MHDMSMLVPRGSTGTPGRGRGLIAVMAALALVTGFGACGDFVLFGDEDAGAAVDALIALSNTQPASCETETVTLDGTASTGTGLTYAWSLVPPDDSAAALEDEDSEETSFTPDKPGTYYIVLTVTDEDGSTDYATAAVVADDTPIAVAAAAPSLSCVGEQVVLDGSESRDPNPEDEDNECSYEELDFAWEITSLPEGSASELDVSDPLAPVFTPDAVGTYTVTLTVSRDGDGASSQATVLVTVVECS